MGKDLGREFYSDSDINPVGTGRNIHFAADLFHPFTSASSHRNNALSACITVVPLPYLISFSGLFQPVHTAAETEFYLVFHFVIKISQNDIINICSQMAHGSVQKLQFILHTQFFKTGSGCRIHLCILSAVLHIDLIHVLHQLYCSLPADILIQCTAEIICNIILSV